LSNLEATKEQISNLNIETFNPDLPHGCIYGQLGGLCHSDEAKTLLNDCAVPYSDKINEYVPATEDHFNNRKEFVAGQEDTYSVLEFAAYNVPDFRKHLIAYLKSEAPTLIF
jgi:hypothetical protein